MQRWTAKRRGALVLSIVRDEAAVVEAVRKYGLTVAESEALQERFAAGAEHALRARPTDEGALTDEQMTRLRQRVGELVRDLDMLRLAAKGRPSDPTTSGEAAGHAERRRASPSSAKCVPRGCRGCSARIRPSVPAGCGPGT